MRIDNVREIWETPESHHRSHKNTKRWCKGKAGREHVFAWEDSHRFRDIRVYKCSGCGKEVDTCWGGGADSPFPWAICHCGGQHGTTIPT